MSNAPEFSSSVGISDLEPTRKHTVHLPRLRHSNWFITINPNKVFETVDDDARAFSRLLQEVLEDVFSEEGIREIVKFRKLPRTWEVPNIMGISADTQVERGTQGRIHSHTLLRVRHRNSLSLDYNRLREKVEAQLGFDGVYMKVDLHRNASDTLESYINKFNQNRAKT